MYKVFIQQSSISFVENIIICQNNDSFIDEHDALAQKETILLQLNEESSNLHYSIRCKNPNKIFQQFFEDYEQISAAGGIVRRENTILAIKRHGVWDLPKGKVEANESIADAAIREIEEETGVTNLQIKRPLITTYHTYSIYGPQTLKTTYWFELSTTSLQLGKPQLEESITEVKWINKEDVTNYFEKSFGTIQLVLEAFLK